MSNLLLSMILSLKQVSSECMKWIEANLEISHIKVFIDLSSVLPQLQAYLGAPDTSVLSST